VYRGVERRVNGAESARLGKRVERHQACRLRRVESRVMHSGVERELLPHVKRPAKACESR
jgi:hypothetical protein